MQLNDNYRPALISSLIFHLIALSIFAISFQFAAPMFVVKNEDNNSHVISAIAVKAPDAPVDPTPTATPQQKLPIQKKVIITPPANVTKPKTLAIPTKKLKKDLSKEFLADIQKETKKKKIFKEKNLEKNLEKELQAQTAKSLQEQLLSEQKRAAGAKALGIVNKYKALIIQAISRQWLVPTGANKSLYSELFIHLAPGGLVLDVQISKSSGDVALDRSARDAVFKASPLPVPEDTSEFEPFRQFVLKVRPENIVNNDA